ncbi:unnamed protein product [Effrenium voratum]|uniref:P-type ATPase C-terminal domain-containing protein n=1 Tax=Effrenium voratum TaxID=2562239 RepID=A0AA36N2H5_9DINO|nr:unnamed protein product [Effrenium voratum]
MAVLLMFYYTFLSGYAGQSLFEDMVRASYNFVLAAPIITTGVFDQDVTEDQVLADPRLYISGREGLDLNAVKLVEMLLSAAVHSCVIGYVMLLVFRDMSILDAGDFYTFGTTVFSVLVISMNYRAAFVTRTWNWVTIAGQAFSFLIYVVFLVVYSDVRWFSDHFQPWMAGVPLRMVSNPYFWICAITLPALAMVIDVFKAHLLSEFYPDRSEVVLEQAKLKASAAGLEELQWDSEEADRAATLHRTNGSVASRMSGYDFAHPGGEPRQQANFYNSHPTAGDVSMIETASGSQMDRSQSLRREDQISDEESDSSEGARSNYPDSSRFAQQKMAHIQVEWTGCKVMMASCLVGVLLFCLGALVRGLGSTANEVSVRYGGAARGEAAARCGEPGSECALELTLPEVQKHLQNL